MSTDRARAAEIYKEMGEVVAPVSPRPRRRISSPESAGWRWQLMLTRLMIVLSKKQQQAQNQDSRISMKIKKQNQDKDKVNQDKR